jgi:hypothetical protein
LRRIFRLIHDAILAFATLFLTPLFSFQQGVEAEAFHSFSSTTELENEQVQYGGAATSSEKQWSRYSQLCDLAVL